MPTSAHWYIMDKLLSIYNTTSCCYRPQEVGTFSACFSASKSPSFFGPQSHALCKYYLNSGENNVQTMSGLHLLTQVLNAAASLALIYCLFSVPTQFIRRFRRKKHGFAVSPVSLIFRKLLKYWFLTALIVIPVSCGLIYMSGQAAGLDGGKIFALMVTQGAAGNILTSMLFGYVFMKANKKNWSESDTDVQKR